jgi:hypothetical protein
MESSRAGRGAAYSPTANAEWSAGAWESSPQCTGIVTALAEGLQARSNQDGNATIEWQYFDYYAFAAEEFKIILNAGAPWFGRTPGRLVTMSLVTTSVATGLLLGRTSVQS